MSRNPRIAKIKAIIASKLLNETYQDEPIDPFIQELDDDSSESYICNTDSDDSSEGRTRPKKEKYLSLLNTRHVSRFVTGGDLTNASLDPDCDKENFNVPGTPAPANRLAENLHDTSVSFDRLFSGGPDFPISPMVVPPTASSEIPLPIIDLPAHDDFGEILCSQFSQKTAHNNSHFIPGTPAPGNRSADILQDTPLKFDHLYSGGPDSPNSSMVAPTNCSEISPIIDLPAHDDSGEIPCSQFSQRTAYNNSSSILDQSTPNMPEAISFEQPETISTPTENQLEVENHKKTRNKRSAPETWKQNVRKGLRQSGKEYVSLRGKKVGARKVRPKDCSNCRRKCNQSFDEYAREIIHNAYWNLKDSDKQKQYVSTLVDEVQTKVKTAGENSRRKMTREFFFYKDGRKVQVCQEFFLKTLDISEGFLRNVLKKRDEARVVAPSNRGKHQPGVTRPIENKEIIETHILSFPTVPSHYCRKKTNYKYLPEDLSLRDMYNLYIKQCTEINVVPEKFWLYRQIFNNCS